MLTTGRTPQEVEVETPSGTRLRLGLVRQETGPGFAQCGVVKDAGDDIDATHGLEIRAEVRLFPGQGVEIKGGPGVGRVTSPGLPVPPGEWAINPVPRRMIAREVASLLPPGYGAEVTITVPGGEEVAARTYNPRLGIVGGISILGTSGIVEPRSQEAYKATVALAISVAAASGQKRLALCFGYLGEARAQALGFPPEAIVRTGDYMGFALEQCRTQGIPEALLVGHLGKLAKVAAGIFNTHFRYGDARMETLAALAGLHGAGPEVIQEVLGQDSAEAAGQVLNREGLGIVFDELAKRVVARASRLVGHALNIDCLVLNLKGEVLGGCPETLSIR